MSEDQTPALEVGDEVVVEDTAQDTQATEEQEAEDTTEGADEASEGDDKVSPSKARRERRKAEMDRLRTETAEAKAEVERLNRMLEDMAGGDAAPKREDFQDLDEYLAAYAAHNAVSAIDKREADKIKKQADEKQAALQSIEARQKAELAQSWADQVTDARTRYADFDAVVNNPTLPVTPEMAQLLAQSDVGADVAYYLGRNAHQTAEIAKMSPLEQAREIGRLESRFSGPRAVKTTQAPDPVTPVRPRASATKDPAKMTMEEYKAWRKSGGK